MEIPWLSWTLFLVLAFWDENEVLLKTRTSLQCVTLWTPERPVISKAISLLLIVLFGRFTSLKRASIVISFCFRSHFVESDLIWIASPTGWPVLSVVSFFSTWSVGAGTFVHYVAFVTAREALETLQKHPITDAQFSHSLYLKALDDEDLKSLSFAKLKRFFVAGEPASKHMVRRWKEETGIELWNYYGQTETVRVL